MRALKRNASGQRVLMALLLVLCLFVLSAPLAAQDPTPGGQPAAPSDLPPDVAPLPVPTLETLAFPTTANYFDVCQNLANRDPNQPVNDVTRPTVEGDVVYYNMGDGRTEVAANLSMPTGAFVSMHGPGAWLQVMEGGVAVVSCGGEMVFDIRSGDNAQYTLPAGTALIVTPDQQDGIFFDLNQMPDWVWIIQIGQGTVSSIDLHVEVGEWPGLICDLVACLGWDDVDREASDSSDRGDVEGGGPCALVRCWSR